MTSNELPPHVGLLLHEPLGARCGAHLATTIDRVPASGQPGSREPLHCLTVVPPGADACPTCGEVAPRVRIGRVVDDGLRFMGADEGEGLDVATPTDGRRLTERAAVPGTVFKPRIGAG